MTDDSVANWDFYAESILAAAEHAPRAVAFLHLPKTGGSSIEANVKSSSKWTKVKILNSLGDPNICTCGLTECRQDLGKHLAQIRTDVTSKKPLFLSFGHEQYRSVRWMLDELSRAGASFELVTTVRPVRARLVSMFTDYWTQVFKAERYNSGEIDLTPHQIRVLSGYLLDSTHYRNGRVIDGEAWFRAFSVHGPGIPFLLSEVFDRSTSVLRDALESGALRVVPTSQLDGFLHELTGKETPERSRVSVALSKPLQDALDQAKTLIDSLVEKEAPYDHVIAEYLGDPSFLP